MRVLHTSDWHVGRTIRGRSRADEHEAVLAEIVSIAAKEEVDLVVVSGDIFDSTSPGPHAERIVYQTLLDLADTGATVALIAGNHDHPRRLQAVAPLLEHRKTFVGSHLLPPNEGGVVQVESSEGELARVALIPFLSQRHIVRADDLMNLADYEFDQKYEARMRRIFEHLTEGMTSDSVNLAVAHLTAVGAKRGGGEREAHTILDYAVAGSVFPGHLHYVALGHLHRQQKVPASAPVWYAGSPLQLDFGETKDEKGVLLIDAALGTPATVSQIPLASGRPLVTLAGTLEQLEVLASGAPDAFLRIVVEEGPRPGLADTVREWFPDAVEVMLAAEAPASTEKRVQRIGRPPRELVREYLESVDAGDERLLALFDELVEELHAPAEA